MMETFASPRSLVDHPGFATERDRARSGLVLDDIDAPIRPLIAALASLDDCFTLQCCHGHFVHAEQPDEHGLAPLPPHDVGPVNWRIAYLALCVRNDASGQRLVDMLAQVPELDPENVQFGCPQWFWERHPNSYVLQVEPERFKHLDQCVVPHAEALRLQKMRDRFFARLEQLVRGLTG